MRSAGDVFELRACAELERAGLKLLARNFSTRYGELDLVMLDRDELAFIEVRYRKSSSHGSAAASITPAKQARLILAAQLWLTVHPQYTRRPCRFDVVSFDGPITAMRTEWLRGAFEAS